MTSLEGITPQALRHIGLQSQTSSSPNSLPPPPPHPCTTSPVPITFHHHMQPPAVANNMSIKLEKAMFGRVPGSGIGNGGGNGGGGGGTVSPPPVSSNPENNACKLIDYRGTKVAAFNVDGRELICLPQAFELFLKHLVGGLHTVYTKLKRLDVVPVVCNVEQVRVLRGLGAIQPGVNRCKLISPKEFDILYEDCTNSSARPGRPPKRSALAMTPEGLDKLKKNRLQMANEFYSPGAVNLIGDAKKSLGFGSGYMPFSELQKSPLLSSGFHYPPAHLAHLAFMPLGHPSMMNLAMATHLSTMREHLVASSHDRSSHGPEIQSLRGGRGTIVGSGVGGGVPGGVDDRLIDIRSAAAAAAAAAEERNNNNCSSSNIGIGNLTTASGNSKAAAAAAAAMMMMIPPSLPPSSDQSILNQPLNLEVQKKSVDPVACRPPSNGSDRDSSAGSSVASDHRPTSGQLNLSKRSSAVGNGVNHYSNIDRQNFRQFGSERHYGNDDRQCSNDERLQYGNDHRMDSEDESGDDRSDEDQEDSNSFKRFPLSGDRLLNGDSVDKMTASQTPPQGYFVANNSEMSTLEAILINIQGLVKLASERACQKEQQMTYERADMRIKTAKEREVREMLEKQLVEERRKKVFLQRKLKKERRTRRSLQDRLQSMDRGKGRCCPPPLPQLPSVLIQPSPAVPTPRSADYSDGSGGEGGGCHDDRHHGTRSGQGQDNRRLRNASVSADDGNDSEHDGSCGSATETRPDDRTNSIHSLMEGFISSAQKGCNASSGQGMNLCGNNGYNTKIPQPLKANDSP